MIERLRELRSNLRGIVAEIDEIERGVIEKPVPWYEEEWRYESYAGTASSKPLFKITMDGIMIARDMNKKEKDFFMGSQKLVRAAKEIARMASGNPKESQSIPAEYIIEMRKALKDMGADKE